MRAIDELAKELAVRFGMPADLHIPIAARNKEAIHKYIGPFSEIFTKSNKALLVKIEDAPCINNKLAIWKVKGSEIFHCTLQVWVHVDYADYRKAYHKAFPEQDLTILVIDHIMNRRVARLKGFEYLRVIPISRAANSSSGNMTEKYAYEYHSTAEMKQSNSRVQPFIQYGDIADIVKMLNIRTGGSFQEGVNEALKYLYEE